MRGKGLKSGAEMTVHGNTVVDSNPIINVDEGSKIVFCIAHCIWAHHRMAASHVHAYHLIPI